MDCKKTPKTKTSKDSKDQKDFKDIKDFKDSKDGCATSSLGPLGPLGPLSPYASPTPLHLFQGIGIELEYMIVDRATLAVAPLCDRVFHVLSGEFVSDAEFGPISWSNELALHVIEFKTTDPVADLAGLDALFHENITRANDILAPLGARLMPSAMHPFMDPHREMRLWPHETSTVYEAFNRIFDCRGHGWANLQSMHINLPFANDEEFARLHAAIRLVLPILPALAASSPLRDGDPAGALDGRLEVYRTNSHRVPSVAGRVIPEPVYTQAAYEREILQRMYRDITPLDPEGILQHEWLNARGAIARFDRNTIEIRVIDVQECPQSDLAIAAATIAVIKALVAERWQPLEAQKQFPTETLESIFLATVTDGEQALITNPNYLSAFGISHIENRKFTAGDLWRHLGNELVPSTAPWRTPLDHILTQGPLARRILRALPANPPRPALERLCTSLCSCLANGEMFAPSVL